MSRAALLQIVERLEAVLGRLPGAIQKSVRSELNPLKQLFLQQRAPRLLLAGSDQLPMPQVVNLLFRGAPAGDSPNLLFEVYRWQTLEVQNSCKIAVLDARGATGAAEQLVQAELAREPADALLVVSDAIEDRSAVKRAGENAVRSLRWNDAVHTGVGVIAIHFDPSSRTAHNGQTGNAAWWEDLKPIVAGRLWNAIGFSGDGGDRDRNAARSFVSLLAQRLPNECRVDLVRAVGDRVAQRDIANILIRSTTAVCTAVGAQPIPLADLPVLTTLQLMMVSGILYLSGRERSLRAAAEFVAALGANVGAGMLLREGARALLKFIPGWGNVVCGMVAGAGTYAIGHAASAYFLEGVSLTEARKRYRKGRARRKRLQLQP